MQAEYCYRYPHPAVTTDVVAFSIAREHLDLLLIKRGQEPHMGMWALPGGFLETDEDLETCARRELLEETGLDELYLEQLCTMGSPNRDPRERVISVAYFALVPVDGQYPVAASDAAEAAWWPVDELPELAFDHGQIVATAHQRLVSKLEYSNIAFQFLPQQFTLSDVQKVYEIISNRTLDKRNFRKQILSLGLVEETGGQRRNGNHRPARLYQATCRNRVQIIK